MISHEEHLMMLEDCMSALNSIPNHQLRHPRFHTSYDLASALQSHINRYKREADVQPVSPT